MKGCPNRATILVAWPMRLPVPACAKCMHDVIKPLRMKAREWFDWLKTHAKEHILHAT